MTDIIIDGYEIDKEFIVETFKKINNGKSNSTF